MTDTCGKMLCTFNAVFVLLMNSAWAESFVFENPVKVYELDPLLYSDSWTITLRDDEETAALTFKDRDSLDLCGGAFIDANTAIAQFPGPFTEGAYFTLDSVNPSRIVGNWDFRDGNVSFLKGTACVQSEGEVQALSVSDGSTLTLEAGTSLRAFTIDVTNATVVLDGHSDSDQIQGSGAWLFVSSGGLSNGSTSDSPSLRVTKNAALVVGTNIGQCNKIGSFESDLAGRNTAIRETMTKILADVDQCTPSGKATLITASMRIPVASSVPGGGEPKPIHISVGTTSADDAAVLVGNDGRWIVYCPDGVTIGTGLPIQPVEDSNATLVLYDWKPADSKDDEIRVSDAWTNAYIVSQYARGRFVPADANLLMPTQVLCQGFAGLRARNLVAEVEDAANQDDLKSLPGYRYILDSFPVTSVGDDAYANHIDSAAFMPVNSGTLAASEQLHGSVAERILRHRASTADADTHWWADVFGEKRTAKNAFQGGSGNWGYKAKSAALSLGADKRFKNGWNATVAFSGMTVDTDTRNLLMGVDGKATGAALTLQAFRDGDWGRVGVQMSASKIQAESTKFATEHRLKTEPELLSAKVTAFWEGECPLGESSSLSPWLSIAGAYVKASDANVLDATSNGLYGVGFENEVERRFLGQVQAGAAWHGQTTLGGFGLSGGIGAYAGAAFGDTDWQIRSKLPGGGTTSVASYAAGPRWNAKLEARVCLGESGRVEETSGGFFGVGAKPTGKLRSFDWRCELWTAYERAEYTQNAWQGGIRFQSVF